MKVEAKQAQRDFRPVTVTITLETEHEYQAFKAMTGKNYTVTDAVRAVRGELPYWPRETLVGMLFQLYQAIERAGEA